MTDHKLTSKCVDAGDGTCFMCEGSVCNYCGAAYWRSSQQESNCEHDVLTRHLEPNDPSGPEPT